jgi:hypothetical protein
MDLEVRSLMGLSGLKIGVQQNWFLMEIQKGNPLLASSSF